MKTAKTPFLPQIFMQCSHRIAARVCCLIFLVASGCPVLAQFDQAMGTNNYNFYASNGTTLGTQGTDPDPVAHWGETLLGSLIIFLA